MDKKFVILMIIFFVVFGISVSFALNQHFGTFARASTETDPSAQTSLIFAWPQVPIPKAGTPIDVDVFVRNINNSPLDKKPVKVVTDLGSINGSPGSASDVTDPSGHVHFKLVSTTPGTAHITAFVTDSSNVSHQLNQTVSVKFE